MNLYTSTFNSNIKVNPVPTFFTTVLEIILINSIVEKIKAVLSY